MATEIDEVYDAEAAMNQLGHMSKVVTERHYINRRLVVPDYRAATDRLAPAPRRAMGRLPGPEKPSAVPNGLPGPWAHSEPSTGRSASPQAITTARPGRGE